MRGPRQHDDRTDRALRGQSGSRMNNGYRQVFPEDDHMIEKFSANTADEALGRPILPGTSEGGSSGMDSESHDRAGDVGREDRVVVEDQESMKGFAGESIP